MVIVKQPSEQRKASQSERGAGFLLTRNSETNSHSIPCVFLIEGKLSLCPPALKGNAFLKKICFRLEKGLDKTKLKLRTFSLLQKISHFRKKTANQPIFRRPKLIDKMPRLKQGQQRVKKIICLLESTKKALNTIKVTLSLLTLKMRFFAKEMRDQFVMSSQPYVEQIKKRNNLIFVLRHHQRIRRTSNAQRKVMWIRPKIQKTRSKQNLFALEMIPGAQKYKPLDTEDNST